MRPIIRDVAARAGVSQKTVSRVINSESGVAAATAARVAAAIDELGLQRNDLARSLGQGTTSSTLGPVLNSASCDELAGGAGEPQGDVEALRARPPHPPAGEGRW